MTAPAPGARPRRPRAGPRARRRAAACVGILVLALAGCAPVHRGAPARIDPAPGELRGGAGCPCLGDPVASVSALDRFGEPFLLTGDWPPEAPDGWARHWQGVQRVAGAPGGPGLLALTFNAERAMLAVAALEPEGGNARLLRVDRVSGSSPHPHPGGIQAVGAYLVVPLETARRAGEPAGVAGIRLGPDGKHRVLWTQPVRGTGAAAAAVTRLRDDRYLMVTAGWGTRELEVFLSTTTDIEAPGWRPLGPWDSRDARSLLPGANGRRDRAWSRYQNLNFVTRCDDGALFLLGSLGPVWPGIAGEERVDAFRFQARDSGRVRVTRVAARRVFCDDGSGRRCHPMAGVGFHVTPAGELIVDAVEHGRSGPGGAARLKTFRAPSTRAPGPGKTPAP